MWNRYLIDRLPSSQATQHVSFDIPNSNARTRHTLVCQRVLSPDPRLRVACPCQSMVLSTITVYRAAVFSLPIFTFLFAGYIVPAGVTNPRVSASLSAPILLATSRGRSPFPYLHRKKRLPIPLGPSCSSTCTSQQLPPLGRRLKWNSDERDADFYGNTDFSVASRKGIKRMAVSSSP